MLSDSALPPESTARLLSGSLRISYASRTRIKSLLPPFSSDALVLPALSGWWSLASFRNDDLICQSQR
jgi:hypothetical protein